ALVPLAVGNAYAARRESDQVDLHAAAGDATLKQPGNAGAAAALERSRDRLLAARAHLPGPLVLRLLAQEQDEPAQRSPSLTHPALTRGASALALTPGAPARRPRARAQLGPFRTKARRGLPARPPGSHRAAPTPA